MLSSRINISPTGFSQTPIVVSLSIDFTFSNTLSFPKASFTLTLISFLSFIALKILMIYTCPLPSNIFITESFLANVTSLQSETVSVFNDFSVQLNFRQIPYPSSSLRLEES